MNSVHVSIPGDTLFLSADCNYGISCSYILTCFFEMIRIIWPVKGCIVIGANSIGKTRLTFYVKILSFPCPDPEIFFRGGPTLTSFCLLLISGSKYYLFWAIIGPTAKRHLNDVSLACQ